MVQGATLILAVSELKAIMMEGSEVNLLPIFSPEVDSHIWMPLSTCMIVFLPCIFLSSLSAY